MRQINRKDITQALAYFISGSSYFWSGYATFSVCYTLLGLPWWFAKGAGDVVGWTLNFILQRYWAFNNPNLKNHEGAVRSRYIMITAVNFALDYAIVGGLKYIGISPYIGLFVSSGFFTVWNYLWYKYWVFPESK